MADIFTLSCVSRIEQRGQLVNNQIYLHWPSTGVCIHGHIEDF